MILTILLAVCFLMTATPSLAAERIEVPKTFPPHPRLFLNQEEIDELKARIAREDWLTDYAKKFVEGRLKDAKTIDLPSKKGGAGKNQGLANKAQNFALAYVLTDRRELAEAAAKILRGYAKVYPTYGISFIKGRATGSTLGEADWGRKVACAYDLIYNSGALSDADKQAIEKNVLRLCAEVLRHCNHAFRSNWRNCAISGFGVIGFCLGDRELLDEALNGIRDEFGTLRRDGFAQHLAMSMLADGVFYERSIGYHTYSVGNYTYLLEAARHSGLDLWHLEITGDEFDAGADVARRFGPTGKKTIKGLFDFPFYYAFGDGSAAAVANARDFRLKRAWYYEAAWRAYRDPKYAWILHRHTKGKRRSPTHLLWLAPDAPAGRFDLEEDARIGLTGRHVNACTLFPNGGYTILRQSGERDAVNLLMTYGKYGSGHSHPDKLGIVLYGAGRQIIPEVNYFRYSGPGYVHWAKQTIGHSTVTVDETAQRPQGASDNLWATDSRARPVRGRPVFFHPGDRLKAFRADCDLAYDGVLLDRTIALVDSVVVDFFRCRSDQQHQYDYALHIDAKLAESSLPLSDPQAGPLSKSRGYNQIAEVRRAATAAQPTELTYKNGEDEPPLHLTFLPAERRELITAMGIRGPKGERCAVVVLRSRGKSVDFVGVMSHVKGRADRPAVRSVEGLADGILGVEITRPDGSKHIVLSAETSRTFEFAGQKITGQMALLHTSVDGTTKLIETVE